MTIHAWSILAWNPSPTQTPASSRDRSRLSSTAR
jgi:hypothetical protein